MISFLRATIERAIWKNAWRLFQMARGYPHWADLPDLESRRKCCQTQWGFTNSWLEAKRLELRCWRKKRYSGDTGWTLDSPPSYRYSWGWDRMRGDAAIAEGRREAAIRGDYDFHREVDEAMAEDARAD